MIERTFRTEAATRATSSRTPASRIWPDGPGEVWVCTQGPYMVRNTCAALLGIEVSRLRVTPSEIGGGFGGKTTVFIEPIALALSRKAGRPVKLVMSRDEVFRATGPTASTSIRVKIGARRDGRITAGEAELKFQGGAFPGAGRVRCHVGIRLLRPRSRPRVGYDVVANRPKHAPYRAPSAPMATFAVESVCRSWPAGSASIRSTCG